MLKRRTTSRMCHLKMELAASIQAAEQEIRSLAYQQGALVEHSGSLDDILQREAVLEAAMRVKQALMTDYRRHLREHSCA